MEKFKLKREVEEIDLLISEYNSRNYIINIEDKDESVLIDFVKEFQILFDEKKEEPYYYLLVEARNGDRTCTYYYDIKTRRSRKEEVLRDQVINLINNYKIQKVYLGCTQGLLEDFVEIELSFSEKIKIEKLQKKV